MVGPHAQRTRGLRRGRVGARLTVGALLAAAVVAGCGGTSSSSSSPATATSSDAASTTTSASSSGVSQYSALAQKYEAPNTTWPGPTTGPKAQPGKTVMMITCSFAVEGCKLPADTVPALEKAIGWKIDVVDGQSSPQVYDNSIQTAINQHMNGIVLIGIASSLVANELKKAREAGLVVASWDSANTPSPDGVNINVDAPGELQGQVLASYLIAQTNGHTDAYVVNDPEFNAVIAWVKGATQTLQNCSTCRIVQSTTIAAADLATTVPGQFVQTLRQNPQINVVVAPYNAAILAVIPAMESAGVLSRVKMGTFSAITAGFTFLHENKLDALIAEPHQWGTWAAFDEMNRVFAHQPQVLENVPIRLFTSANPGSLPTGGDWEGDVNYQQYFEKIWSGS